MAQQVLVSVVDDLDGSEADAGTIRFGVNGTTYEIDLSVANATRLRTVFAPYIAAGHKASRRGSPAGRGGQQRSGRTGVCARSDWSTVRRWANEHGYNVSARGGIPAEVTAAYDARDQAPAAAAKASPGGRGRGDVDPLEYSAEVRQWATANGHKVGTNGRMPARVVEAFLAAQQAGGKRSGRRRGASAPTFSG